MSDETRNDYMETELDKERVAREAEVARLRAREAAEQRRVDVEATIIVRDLESAVTNRQTEIELRHAEARQRLAAIDRCAARDR